MSDERKNIFERKARPKPSLADDRKNRFTRHEEAVAEKRSNTASYDARIAHELSERRRWNRLDEPQRTASGLALDPELSELKRRAEEERTEPKGPPAQPEPVSAETVEALTAKWREKHPEFAPTDFNLESFINALCAAHESGRDIRSLEAIEEIYQRLLANNHIEPCPGVRRRGTCPRVPTVFEFVPREERAARAQALPFEELRSIVRSKYRPERPQMAPRH